MKRCVETLATILAVLLLTAAAHADCLSCHEGIEQISEVDGMADLDCVDCHMGDDTATEIEAAHKDMYANPGDLRVIDETCGTCHPDEVEILMKSLHATSAGIISGSRYAQGAQDRASIYANYAVSDDDPSREGALKELKQIPSYDPAKPEGSENHLIDDYLRNQCLRCHIWSDGHQRDGDYRASGCSACHVLYSDAGTYEGGDKAIDKTQKDRPRFHRITNKIDEVQCIHCHNRGARTGVSYIGTMESDGYGTPWTATGGKQGKLHGKNYNHLQANVHFDAGMTCIDCHTKSDVHGDGNIYGKKEQAVEIECENCHGTIQEEATLKTAWGNPLPNVKREGNKVILTAKLTGKKHEVSQIKNIPVKGQGHLAMVSIPKHMETMECYTCHSRWAPQCYGCHAKQDIGKASGDWLQGKDGGDPSMTSHKGNRLGAAKAWSESRSYLRWESPIIGWNSEGKISPYIPGCQAIFTQVDGDKPIFNNKIYTTVDGTSGIGTNPVAPHTTSLKARSCADCHMNPKTAGLGSGFYISGKNGLDIEFELERIVDEEGKQIQNTTHVGARPMNKEEQQRFLRVGTCLACHGPESPMWEKSDEYDAPTDARHTEAIRGLIK